MGGTKTLADLFTDRGVPRSLRRTLPMVTVDGEVAWVAGVAVSEDFRLDPEPSGRVLSARSSTSTRYAGRRRATQSSVAPTVSDTVRVSADAGRRSRSIVWALPAA